MTPDSANQALILGVNYVSNDDYVSLFLQKEDMVETILTTTLNWGEHYEEGTWRFRVHYRPGESIVIEAGRKDSALAVIGQTGMQDLPSAEYCGMMYAYTSSKDRLLWLDDLRIEATFTRDTLPPMLDQVYFRSRQCLEFRFNEDVFPKPGIQLTVNEFAGPDSLAVVDHSIIAWFSSPFLNEREYSFNLGGVSDRKGNIAKVSGLYTFFIPSRYDVVISEIMADPTPPVYLSENEYMEIYNRCMHDINLEGWTVTAGKRLFTLGKKTIPPGGFHILCAGEAAWLYPVDQCSPVFTSSSLTNSGQVIILRNHIGEVIDALRYSDSWYGDNFKSEGGWSLERVDNNFFCGDTQDWRASESPEGGTPGKVNSVAGQVADNTIPFVEHVIYDTAAHYRFAFNEPVSFAGTDSGEEILYSYNVLQSVVMTELTELFRDTLLVVVSPGTGNGLLPVSFKKGFSDCSGNFSLPADTFFLGCPVLPGFTDIIITEVLYSPFPGCSEFVELYNRSGKILTTGDLMIETSGDNAAGAAREFLSDADVLFPPGTFLVLTKEPVSLPVFYDVPDRSRLFLLPGMPSLGNSGGRVRLMLRSGGVIDEMHYDPRDHYSLISDDHGISLERMTLSAESGMTAPWHSASSLAGFATPGYRNSQFIDTPESISAFSVDKDVFTPDNNGIDDMAIFRFRFEKAGYTGTLRIFDPLGHIVRTVGMNELLGAEGFFTWDGRDDSGRLCSRGIYLAYFEAWHLSGRKKAFKKAVVLARR